MTVFTRTRRVLYKAFPTVDDLINEGFDITFEAGLNTEDDNGKEARWYCDLYFGDSNNPCKLGTKTGVGVGMSQGEAYKAAILYMSEVYA